MQWCDLQLLLECWGEISYWAEVTWNQKWELGSGHVLVEVTWNSVWGAGKGCCGGTWFITATTITASVCHGWKYINSLLAGEKVTPQNPKYYTFKCSGSPAWEEGEVRQIVQCCKSQESGELNLAHRMLKTWKSREFKGKRSVDGRIIFGDF